MTKDHATVWGNCLQTIRKNVNQQSFKTWFEPIKPVRLDQNALTIQVPNKFFYEWLEEHYVNLLKTTIRRELGDRGRLEYQILMSSGSSAAGTGPSPKNGGFQVSNSGGKAPAAKGGSGYAPGMVDTQSIQNPFVIPGIRKVKVESQLNPNYLFDNYIEGDCNRLARSAGLAIAKKPGTTSFNPLVIFGDVGLGKTHLAHAIGNDVLTRFPSKTVLYVSSEKFTNQIIQSIKNNAVNDFVNFYQLIDVLIVDDIQFLANKQKTQEIFFHIFNQLHQNGKQIILTSDRPPKDLDGMEERLISRFKWGLSADLQAPELETRIAILESKMNREGLELPADVTEFICYNIQNNIRELEGVLVSLMAQSSLNRREIDMDLTKQVIRNFVKQINKEITVEYIQKLVAEHFSLPVDKLQGKTRKRQVVIARQLSMYLAKNLTDKSLKAIGENFGGRDHSTVIYSCKTVSDLMETDMIFKDTVAELEKKIKLSLHDQ
ncbi:chromosomal replication initiator protein DnaA [Phaeodactylibacter luteus]|uniref:Chromosomal replication initiator protein DnaA n=1 Tax=Phaeodactylibacter luteus TaxID=1564516 RepID=A0A5C6S5B9_9BACT|nr:chromosomal replication initiator protein DnaA [Phaeodactylibacter luteus]TXB69467.1 chromosomal replication initiator protein DnaA [Phaeodactylibacter luteus]